MSGGGLDNLILIRISRNQWGIIECLQGVAVRCCHLRSVWWAVTWRSRGCGPGWRPFTCTDPKDPSSGAAALSSTRTRFSPPPTALWTDARKGHPSIHSAIDLNEWNELKERRDISSCWESIISQSSVDLISKPNRKARSCWPNHLWFPSFSFVVVVVVVVVVVQMFNVMIEKLLTRLMVGLMVATGSERLSTRWHSAITPSVRKTRARASRSRCRRSASTRASPALDSTTTWPCSSCRSRSVSRSTSSPSACRRRPNAGTLLSVKCPPSSDGGPLTTVTFNSILSILFLFFLLFSF